MGQRDAGRADGAAPRGTTGTALPVRLTSLVGRQDEQVAVRAAFADHRLVTVTGPGGIGKTRVALAVAGAMASDQPDEVCWVDVGSLTTADQLVHAVAAATRVLVRPAEDARATLVRQLRDRRQLVCLDTCEHLLAECAGLVDELLRGCPAVRVLATSREQLGVPGEVIQRIPPLTRAESVQLFEQRALLARADYVVDGDRESAVCGRLDGVPLAVELAAGWVSVLPLEEIAARLGDRLILLVGGSRFAEDRHRSLAACLEWSYHLLDADDRALFRGLSVFAGGFTVEAAAAVCRDGGDGDDVLARIKLLADKSLVVADLAGGVRFQLLDTVREFAESMLVAEDEVAARRNRHLQHFLAFAELAEVQIEHDQDRWRRALDAERDNLRAAVTWGLRAADPEPGRRLVAALARYWFICGHTDDGERYLHEAIDLAPDERSWLQAALLSGAAALAAGSARGAEAAELGNRGLAIATEVGDQRHAGRCVGWTVHSTYFFDSAACHQIATEAGRLGALAGDPFTIEHSAVLRARSFSNRDLHRQALAELGDAGVRARARGDRMTTVFTIGVEVWADLLTGDVRRATERAREALAVAEPLGDHFTVGHMSVNLAWALALSGEFDAARELITPVVRSVGQQAPDLVRWFALIPARLELWHGNLNTALHWVTDAARFAEPATDNWQVAQVLPVLAGTLRRLERIDEARDVAQRAVAMAARFEVPHAHAEALDELGHLTKLDGHRGEALRIHRQALGVRLEHDLRTFWPDSFDAIAAAVDDPQQAVRLLAAADAGRATVGRMLPPVDHEWRAKLITSLQQAIDEAVYTEEWSAGSALSMTEAAAMATHRRRRSATGSGWSSITATERQVVDLVVLGLTNPAISARLFMSRSTVKTHLAHIFAKIGVANRTELAAAAGRAAAGAALDVTPPTG